MISLFQTINRIIGLSNWKEKHISSFMLLFQPTLQQDQYRVVICNIIQQFYSAIFFATINLLIFLNTLAIFKTKQLMVNGNSKMLLFLSINVSIFSFSLLIATVYLLNCILWHVCHGKKVNNEVGDSTISHTKIRKRKKKCSVFT